MNYWEYIYNFEYQFFWEEVIDQCTWDDLNGVKETLSSIWNKLSSDDIQRIEEQFEKK
jgi:hypothetical protein